MGDFVASLLESPPDKQLSPKEYDKKAHEFVKKVSGVSDSHWTKAVNKQNVLDLLNPTSNSIAYIYGLAVQSEHVGKDRARNEELLNRAVIFLTSLDPIQIRYADEAWARVMFWLTNVYPQLGITDLTPITTAMLRLDPACSTFTCTHLRLLRLALQIGAPSQALPILDKNITAFPQTPAKGLPDELLCDISEQSNAYITAKSGFAGGAVKSEHVLEYYLLGAHVYIGLRNFARARLFLEYLMLTPTAGGSCSAMQAEAYKKWLLLGLLAQGQCYPLPRTHNQQVTKSMKAVGKAYEALADCFERRAWRKFSAEADVGQQIWREDGNSRLVKEVADALTRYRVLDLQRTYAALPVSRVADLLSSTPDATMALLTDMLAQGYIDAHITPSSTGENVLQFHLSPTPTQTSPTDTLESQTQRIQSLTTTIRDADRRLQLSKEYIEVQKRNKRGGAGPDGDLADQMDLTYDAPITGLMEDDDEGGGFGTFGTGGGGGDEDIMEG